MNKFNSGLKDAMEDVVLDEKNYALDQRPKPDALADEGTSKRRLLPALRKTVTADVLHKVTQSAGRGGGLLWSFMIFVVIPSFVVLTYYLLFATDVYVAEGKLTVREAYDPEIAPSPLGSNSLSSIVSKIGLSSGASTSQDSMIIMDYIKSRAAIVDVGGRERLAHIYDQPTVDWFSRLDSSDDFEELWAYWKTRVTASVDTLSNILTLRVRAYEPNDSLALAQDIMSKSEALINNISRRNREDALDRARAEVDRSMNELAEVRSGILSFQKHSNTIDPLSTAKQVMTIISELTLKKIELESQLASANMVGASNRPGDKFQKTTLDVINKQISELQKLLTGTTENSLSSQLKDYELLKLKEQFVEQLYTVARASFEEARRKVDKQQLYVVTVVPPQLPDAATYPKPMQEAGVVFLSLLVTWAIGCLLVATVRDSAQSS